MDRKLLRLFLQMYAALQNYSIDVAQREAILTGVHSYVSYLEDKGWIESLKNGKYAISRKVPKEFWEK